MPQRKTNRGQVIDFDSLMEQQGGQPALGNMKTDAFGNRLGPNGEIIESAEKRARKHYKGSTGPARPTSLKTDLPSDDPSGETRSKVKTPTKNTKKTDINQTAVDEEIARARKMMEEMKAKGVEPVGQREIELSDGSIEVIPIYPDEDFDGGFND